MASNTQFHKDTPGLEVAKAFPDSIRGKVIMITGVNPKGIGFTTAEALASQQPKLLILTGRSQSKVDEAQQKIKASYPDVETRFLELDLSVQASVRTAAAEVMKYSEDIDILINNAGVMAIPERTVSKDGIEMQFATNHIGHFLFTNLILSKLTDAAKHNSPGATRVVNVSSFGHHFSGIRFSDYNWEKTDNEIPESDRGNIQLAQQMGMPGSDKKLDDPGYQPVEAYGQSKTANVLLALSLNEKLAAKGIRSFGLHPGAINTELARHLDDAVLKEWRTTVPFVYKSLEAGSSTTLVAALDPALKADGKNIYLSDCQLADAASWAVDPNAAEKLWKLSEKLVGEDFALA